MSSTHTDTEIQSPSTAATMLGPSGPLAQELPGFMPRAGQQAMASLIEAALDDQALLVTESGTGTGKTFAYLVPAVLSGKRVIISTGTKHLQDQIFDRDLPRVKAALASAVNIARLKGRANYLCNHRLDQLAGTEIETANRTEIAAIRRWATLTCEGDIAEVAAVGEDAQVWRLVTSTSDNCLGGKCPQYEECFVRRARKQALEAEIVVVNHHLFFADLALRVEGFGQLLPGADAVIFDEAHQLPDIATNFFGRSISRAQIDRLVRDTQAEEIKECSGVKGLSDAGLALEKSVADFRLSLGVAPRRAEWASLEGAHFHASFNDMIDTLNVLGELLSAAAGSGEGLANCARRAGELLDTLYQIKDGASHDTVTWFESFTRGFTLYLTPVDIAVPFGEHLDPGERAWIFTSATLTVDGRFDHFLGQLGLDGADTALWDSPFDYAAHSLMYLPKDLPAPNSATYTEAVIDFALPVLEASGGGAFMLFTSHRALKQAAQLLSERCEYLLLVQGDAPKAELLARFKDSGNAVLLGTASFWEGVDVPGRALSCVIIDKLPFMAPDEPVLRARSRIHEQEGRNPFMTIQLPQAVIALKQGTGRLIRTETDSGVLMICDPRLHTKGYARIFLKSLPPMPKTNDLEDVMQFYKFHADDY